MPVTRGCSERLGGTERTSRGRGQAVRGLRERGGEIRCEGFERSIGRGRGGGATRAALLAALEEVHDPRVGPPRAEVVPGVLGAGAQVSPLGASLPGSSAV